jgi:hypothetical protein
MNYLGFVTLQNTAETCGVGSVDKVNEYLSIVELDETLPHY